MWTSSSPGDFFTSRRSGQADFFTSRKKSEKYKVARTKYRTGQRTNPADHFAAACPQRSQMLPNFFLTSFYMVDSSNYPGYIVRTPTNSVQHRWPPGSSTIDLFSLLDLFTRLDHRLCTVLKQVHPSLNKTLQQKTCFLSSHKARIEGINSFTPILL